MTMNPEDLRQAYEALDRRMQAEAAALRQEWTAYWEVFGELVARERAFYARWRAETEAIGEKAKE